MTGEYPCHERLGCPLFVNDQATGGIVRRRYPAMPSCSSPISGRAVDVAKAFQRIIAIVVPSHPVAQQRADIQLVSRPGYCLAGKRRSW
ncbi:hypothetical protein [Nisaea sp.]|uniref:hypothetical protein n=1 Tax=Nisaea sp. TaxID=2024842 RepID=UPI0032F09CBF